MTFREWLGFDRKPKYSKVRWFGPFVGVLIALTVFAILIGGFATLIQFIKEVTKFDSSHEAIRNIGLILVAIVGAPFVLWRAVIAQKQADTSEQSHITDQINKAVAGLGSEKSVNKIGRSVTIFTGDSRIITHQVQDVRDFYLIPKSIELKRYHDISMTGAQDDIAFEGTHIDVQTWEAERTEIEWQGDSLEINNGEAIGKVGDWTVFSETMANIEVRIGAIYALERISRDSIRDHIQIMEILTAYIRENAPVTNLTPKESPFMPTSPRSDIQAALDVIGRRSPEAIALERGKKYRLDLRKVNLSGGNFANGVFEGAVFFGSRLEASIFRSCNLRGARLQGCLLNFSDFFDANLSGAIIDHAIFNAHGASRGSITHAVDIRGLSMAGADISAVSYFPRRDTHKPTFGTSDTVLPSDLARRYDERHDDMEEFSSAIAGVDIENEIEIRSRLEGAGFLYWSPYNADDLASVNMHRQMLEHLKFTGFPFFD